MTGSSEPPPLRESVQRVIVQGNVLAQPWLTCPNRRLIAVVVPHLQALERMLDWLPLFEADHRVQVVWVVPATGYIWAGMEEMVRSLGGMWVPWQQALEMRFDLILTACRWGALDLHGPVVFTAHGVGMVRSRIAPWSDRMPHDLHPGNLMRGDEVAPAAICLAHDGEVAVLAESCPQAVSRAVVVGDVSFDRMLASRPYVDKYRDALEVGDRQRLVVVTSTWGPHSLLGTDLRFFARLMAELPAKDYRVVCAIHPFAWLGHGRRQILAWLQEARRAGMGIVEPDTWRAALVSADLTIGDQGSGAVYAAGLGIPVMINTASRVDVRVGSTVDLLASVAPALHLDRPLLAQVEQAIDGHDPQRYAHIAQLITSRPGQAGAIMRPTLYKALNLSEPGHAVPVSAVPLPKLIR